MTSAPRRLLVRLASVREPAMQTFVVVEALVEWPLADGLAVLDALTRRGEAAPALARALADARLDYDRRATLYAAAKEAGRLDLARLFFAAGPPSETEPPPPAPEQPVQPYGRAMTLGERKALARRTRSDLLARLLRDPDPHVIRSLLANPRVTERDVIVVAARRPARADVLRMVFDCDRWQARYHVKRALVMNPYTPGDIAVRLLPALTASDLRAVAAAPSLSGPLRAQAALLVSSSCSPC